MGEFDDSYLHENCVDCGEPFWMHVCRREGDLVDILPCLEMLIDYVGEAKWLENADELGLCRKCGKSLRNHLVFERPGIKVLGKTLWMRKPEIMIVFPCAELPCHLVTDEVFLGRSPPPVESSTAPKASVPTKPARKIPIRAMPVVYIPPPSPSPRGE